MEMMPQVTEEKDLGSRLRILWLHYNNRMLNAECNRGRKNGANAERERAMNIEIMIAPGCREEEKCGGKAEEKRRHICGCCGSNQNAAKTMQPARQWNGNRGSTTEGGAVSERESERGEGRSGGNCTPQCSQTINENGQQSCHQNAWKTGKSGAQMLEMEMET